MLYPHDALTYPVPSLLSCVHSALMHDAAQHCRLLPGRCAEPLRLATQCCAMHSSAMVNLCHSLAPPYVSFAIDGHTQVRCSDHSVDQNLRTLPLPPLPLGVSSGTLIMLRSLGLHNGLCQNHRRWRCTPQHGRAPLLRGAQPHYCTEQSDLECAGIRRLLCTTGKGCFSLNEPTGSSAESYERVDDAMVR